VRYIGPLSLEKCWFNPDLNLAGLKLGTLKKMIRPIAALVLAVAFGLSAAAEERLEREGARTVQPQVVFNIQHVEGTGDIVQLSFKPGIYDDASLALAVEKLGKLTGAAITDLHVIPPVTADEPVRAMFTAKNILDPAVGDIRLQPVVRAFMTGAKDQRVDSFSIRILGQQPSAYTTLASYSSKAVALRAFFDAKTPSIEYRILVMAESPADVDIPPRHEPDPVQLPQKDGAANRTPLLVSLVLLAGASAGALVYFGLLGKRS
jgi:hypothetical protein